MVHSVVYNFNLHTTYKVLIQVTDSVDKCVFLIKKKNNIICGTYCCILSDSIFWIINIVERIVDFVVKCIVEWIVECIVKCIVERFVVCIVVCIVERILNILRKSYLPLNKIDYTNILKFF